MSLIEDGRRRCVSVLRVGEENKSLRMSLDFLSASCNQASAAWKEVYTCSRSLKLRMIARILYFNFSLTSGIQCFSRAHYDQIASWFVFSKNSSWSITPCILLKYLCDVCIRNKNVTFEMTKSVCCLLFAFYKNLVFCLQIFPVPATSLVRMFKLSKKFSTGGR